MDHVALHGIDVFAHHGVHAAERELGQRFVVDVVMAADCEAAAASDQLEHAVDYAAVHRRVVETVGAGPCNLIEAVAGRLCRSLLEAFPVAQVTVTVGKPQAPIPGFRGMASVTLTRDRDWLARRGERS